MTTLRRHPVRRVGKALEGTSPTISKTLTPYNGMDMDTEVTDIVELFGLGYRIITNWELP